MATINLTSGDDNYSDNDAANTINAFAGDDLVRGNGGADRILGGRGSDGLFGGDGNDRLFDSAVTEAEGDTFDRLVGGAGDDLIDVRQGTNEFGDIEASGGLGTDTIRVSRSGATVRGDEGDDLLDVETNFGGEVSGGDGNDRIEAGVNDGSLQVTGDDGRDTIVLQSPTVVFEGGADAFGGDGNDTIDARALTSGRLDGGAGGDTIFAADNSSIVVGGSGADRLIGRDRADSYDDEGGEDSFRYRQSDLAGDSVDRIEGFEPGLDRIDVAAIDAVDRTAQTEDFDFVGQDATPAIGELGFSRSGGDTLVALNYGDGVERIRLVGLDEPLSADDFVGARPGNGGKQPTERDDQIVGTDGPDTIDGLAGDDVIDGRRGADRLIDGDGADVLVGGDGNDRLTTEYDSDLDRLSGGPGEDRLFAAEVIDVPDELDGGTGADNIVLDDGPPFFESNEGPIDSGFRGGLVVEGFEPSDILDISGFDADFTRLGNQAFTFIGEQQFSEPGQVRYDEARGGELNVQLNTDSSAETPDGGRDFENEFTLRDPEVAGLVRGDFVL